jgi:hypothetical protein
LEDEYTEEIAKPIPLSVELIDLPLAELQPRTGIYRNLTSGNIWELELKDEKLMARRGWVYFQLIPIDSNRFQSVECNFDYIFEFPVDNSKVIIKVDTWDVVNGSQTFTLEKTSINSTNLATDYIDTYYSNDLDVSYNIYSEEGNKLFVRYKGKPPFQLKSDGEDIFRVEADKFEFIRDEQGRVIGFDRCSDRVRRLHFSKQ